MKKFLIFTPLLTLAYWLLSSNKKIDHDFYHWQFTYAVKGENAPRYIKVLDVTYRQGLVYQETNFKETPKKEVVPVLYLDNSIWRKMKAQTMVNKVLISLKKMPIKYSEIQVDCDWTDSTRSSYFEFLKGVKERSGKKLSTTIRLHQVKYYKKTGVPPVDYGVLMYYNMSDVRDIQTKNYILDLDVAKRYHYNFDRYPLSLNLALPLYAQATIIRFSEVVGLVDGIREVELGEYFRKIEEHLYKVEKTHYFKERLYYKGDKLRVDEVDEVLLYKTIEALKLSMHQPKEIIFYRWANREHYKEQKLKDIVESW